MHQVKGGALIAPQVRGFSPIKGADNVQNYSITLGRMERTSKAGDGDKRMPSEFLWKRQTDDKMPLEGNYLSRHQRDFRSAGENHTKLEGITGAIATHTGPSHRALRKLGDGGGKKRWQQTRSHVPQGTVLVREGWIRGGTYTARNEGSDCPRHFRLLRDRAEPGYGTRRDVCGQEEDSRVDRAERGQYRPNPCFLDRERPYREPMDRQEQGGPKSHVYASRNLRTIKSNSFEPIKSNSSVTY